MCVSEVQTNRKSDSKGKDVVEIETHMLTCVTDRELNSTPVSVCVLT